MPIPTFQEAKRKGFIKGGGTIFTCRSCNRKTRPVGSDGDYLKLCEDCYELAGIENAISDGGKPERYAAEARQLWESIKRQGGDPSFEYAAECGID